MIFASSLSLSIPQLSLMQLFSKGQLIKWLLLVLDMQYIPIVESATREVYKKCVPKYFVKFTGKQLCHSLFFNKVAGLRPETLLKKILWHRCFPVKFVKFLKILFFIEHLQWLLRYLKLGTFVSLPDIFFLFPCK